VINAGQAFRTDVRGAPLNRQNWFCTFASPRYQDKKKAGVSQISSSDKSKDTSF